MMPWMVHGGSLEAARAHYGDGAAPWVDLSTGINPHPWPGTHGLTIDWQRLPEPGALVRLEEASARYFGVPSAHVCAVPGSEIGLRLVAALLDEPIAAAGPCYGSYRELGATVIARDGIAASRDALLIANPNNPDGHCYDKPAITKLTGERWLLIDEAFADCRPEESVADWVRDDRRLIVFRSFGKFFGLAGLRLGSVIAPSTIIDRLRRQLGAWPISAAAIAIGTAAYGDRAWIDATRARLNAGAARLDALLAKAGFTPIGNCPCFRLIETHKASALFEHLARSAILARPFADRPDWLRFGLPADDAGFDRLEQALADG
jgi:cobalamin biosynthetic protein CobC